MTNDDMELVREYARGGSEEAFAALVSRHVNLVYSVAWRQTRDAHLAEEIAQTVFLILARKAASLSPNTVVSGWLCQTARYAAAKALTMRQRRQNREQQAYMQSTQNDSDSADAWMQIEPMLERAMGELSRKDHDAIVVRFFEKRSFAEAGAMLGTTEAGAKMRVNRALEKLRKIFGKQGAVFSTALIASAVSAYSVQAAPAGAAASIVLAAHGTAAASTLTLAETTIKYMAWTKIKTAAVVGAAALLTLGTANVVRQKPAAAPPAKGAAVARYATPEATIQALIEALKVADTEKFAEACTPNRAERFRAQNEGKTPEELSRTAKGMAAAFSKFAITRKDAISPTEMLLHVEGQGATDSAPHGGRNLVMRMIKIGPDWKYDGDVR